MDLALPARSWAALVLLAWPAAAQQSAEPPPFAAPSGTPTPSRAVVFDVATGEELEYDLAAPSGAGSSVSPGWSPFATIAERVGDGWLLDLNDIEDQDFPWSAQCRIYVDKSGGTVVGSGTLVGPRHLLTAGHVIWDSTAGTWGTNVRIRPAWDGDSDAYGDARATRLASFTGFTLSGNPDHDMGRIEVDRPVGFLTGWFGYGWTLDDSYYTTNLWNRAGYPGGSTCYAGAPNQLYYGAGVFDSTTTYQLEADLNWSCLASGMSGAGVYVLSGSSRTVHAVSRATGNVGSTPMTKYDTRMTEGKFDFFADPFVPDGYSDVQMDLPGTPPRSR